MSGSWDNAAERSPARSTRPPRPSQRSSARLVVGVAIEAGCWLAMPFTPRLPPVVTILFIVLAALAATVMLAELLQRRKARR